MQNCIFQQDKNYFITNLAATSAHLQILFREENIGIALIEQFSEPVIF